jgi:ribonuclease HI
VRIAGFFAGICEPCSPGGVAAFGAVIKIDGAVAWSDSAIVAQRQEATTNVGRYRGAIVLLKKLHELQTANPEAHVILRTDSAATIGELEGAWRGHAVEYAALVEESIALVAKFGGALVMRYCSRRENAEAHALAIAVLRRAGLNFSDRYIRP